MRVSRGMDCTNSSAFDAEYLTIGDLPLAFPWSVLVDRVGNMWVKSNKVRDTTGVIAVPVRQQYVR